MNRKSKWLTISISSSFSWSLTAHAVMSCRDRSLWSLKTCFRDRLCCRLSKNRFFKMCTSSVSIWNKTERKEISETFFAKNSFITTLIKEIFSFCLLIFHTFVLQLETLAAQISHCRRNNMMMTTVSKNFFFPYAMRLSLSAFFRKQLRANPVTCVYMCFT